MAQIKAYQVDGFISKPDKSLSLVLLYGPDQGLVSERADKLTMTLGFTSDNSLSIIRFDADAIASDPGKLADEAFAISMFATAKLLRIKGTTRKNLLPALKSVLENPPPECWIIFEGGDLKRDSALRKLVEKASSAMALPCYQDNAAALDQLIREEITAHNLSMDEETKTHLRSMLGEDRRASRNELKKLALYAHGTDTITRRQITDLLGNVSSVVADDIIHAASQGNTDFLASKLDQLFESGSTPDMLISHLLRHFQLLHRLKSSMSGSNADPSSLISQARPPIHFSRHQAVKNSLRIWTMDKLQSAMERLNQAFYQARSNPALARSLAATTLLAIALQAKRR